jgi:DNA (cytosine-5)-methyltransferase 1
VGAVEIDLDAAATFAVNFGDHVCHGDITDWASGSLPFAEVVVGGPPCQGFSLLGRRDGADPRNKLWAEYVRVLNRVRPAFFVLENVTQFLRSTDFSAFSAEARRGGTLDKWELETHVLDSSQFGVAQVRKRAFVIGRPAGMRPLGPPRPTTRPMLRDILRDVDPGVAVAELPSTQIELLGQRVAGSFRMRDLHVTPQASDLQLQRYRAIRPGGGRRDLPEHLKFPAWKREFAGAGDVMGRLRWDRPAVTIRTEFFRPEKGRFLHPDEQRPLTHYEAALIQGFPETYLWCGSKASIARQIGNAVPVPLASALAEHLAAHLN